MPHHQESVALRSWLPQHLFFSLTLLCSVAFAFPANSRAQSDQIIYQDSFVNGWQGVGDASCNYDNLSPVHSGSASIGVNAAPMQKFKVSHSSFDPSNFHGLTFWINGGPVGGQRLYVRMAASDRAPISILTLPANTWRQISIPLSTFGVVGKQIDGFEIQNLLSSATNFYLDDIRLTAVPPPSTANSSSDQIIYDDSLVNGWQDWGWATHNYNNSSPTHSGGASVSVNAAAFEALKVHHNAFDPSYYQSLNFWINGGETGGQRLRVQALINDKEQTPIEVPALQANTWQQVIIPIASLGISDNMDGFWIQNLSGDTLHTFYVDDIQLVAAPPPSLINISANVGQIIRTADSRLFGLNVANWDLALNTPSTISLLHDIDSRAYRFPGGAHGDKYHWATNSLDDEPGATYQRTSFDEFANVALSTQAQAFITVNYGSGTPQEAADWVRYSNVTKHYGFKYWEIGNECYFPTNYDKRSRPHDPYTYALAAKEYITQMKAVDPTIKIGVVVSTEYLGSTYTDHPATNQRTGEVRNDWDPVLLTTLKNLGVTPDFIIHHQYPQTPETENDASLLQAARRWKDEAGDLRQQLTDYMGAAGADLEMVCTENNSVSHNPGKQVTSLVNGLYLADSTGQILLTEFNALLWYDLLDSQNFTGNNSQFLYGWRLYGDYGMRSPQGELYPAFYVSKLLKYFARGGDQVVKASSDYSLLSVYAAKRFDDSLSLLIINKSPTANLKAHIAVFGYAPVALAHVYSYGIPQDEAVRTGIGSPDLAQSTLNNAGSSFEYAFPSYSVTVISLSPSAPNCNVSLSSASQPFNATGGVGTVTVSASDCAWTAISNVPWITIASGASGTGNGTVSYSVALNTGTIARSGTITIGAQIFTVNQAAPTWEAVILTAGQADIKTWTTGGTTYAYLKLSFPNAGYRVVNFGTATRVGNDFTGDALVEKFTGASVLAATTTAGIYDLGALAPGSYNFTFKNTGVLVKTVAFTVAAPPFPANSIDDARQFVKQQYRDFLNREADQAGEDFWTDNITKCSDPARRPAGQTVEQCTLRQRETTSGAFFLSPEFQYTGYYVYRMYQGGLGRQPKLSEFTPDAQFVGAEILVNSQLSAAKINQNKADFAAQFVNCTDAARYRCSEFKAIYDGLSNQQYVDKLFLTTGVNASASDRTALVNGLNANPATETRASVLQKVVDGVTVLGEGNQQFTTTYGQAFYDQQFTGAFVQLEYFGYMKRDPDDAGYAFWLGKLNLFGGNFVNAEMVLAFISSPEYRAQFGQP